jgi:hypothetical protein
MRRKMRTERVARGNFEFDRPRAWRSAVLVKFFGLLRLQNSETEQSRSCQANHRVRPKGMGSS